MKHVEFFKMQPGYFFRSVWKGQEPGWYYRFSVSIEYHECYFKQSFWNRLIYGKLPSLVANRHYSNDPSWMNSDVLIGPEYYCKEFMIDICNDDKKDIAIQSVLDMFNDIIETCPVDNIIVFGYDNLTFEGDKIIPLTYQIRHNEWNASIQCGFAGY